MKSEPEVMLTIVGIRLSQRPLSPRTYVIGRETDCDIVVDQASMSSQHARLRIASDGVSLEDLGSTNGTFVDERRLSHPELLQLPQWFRLGSTWFEVKRVSNEAASGTLSETVREGKANATEFTHYRLGNAVNQGGMGAVYEAYDAKLDRTVALKRILPEKAKSESRQRRFQREAKILSQLEHPQIVPIYDMGRDAQGQPFYTMKLVQGVTLHQVLADIQEGKPDWVAQYPLAQLLTIFQKICDAVAFAHARGLIHRDLKPANIMLGQFGEVLVMDWGLAKIMTDTIEPVPRDDSDQRDADLPDGGAGQTLEGEVLGTPCFMAPEQAEGRISAIDSRTDVFALGGILYNILTLHPPVSGATAAEALGKIKSGAIVPPSTYNLVARIGGRANKDATLGKPGEDLPHCPGRRIPEALSAVAMKALALVPEGRYPSVAELQRDVAAFQGGYATQAEQAGAWRLICLAVKRRQTEFGLAAAVLVILAIVVGVSLRQVTQALAELRQAAPTHFEKAQALVQTHQFEAALERVSYAVTLVPANQEYRLTKGGLLQTLFRFEEARLEFKEILRRTPTHDRARLNLELCDHLIALDQGAQKRPSETAKELLGESLRDQKRTSEAVHVEGTIKQKGQLKLARGQEKLKQADIQGKLDLNPGNDMLLDTDDDTLSLEISQSSIADLTPLQGMPLNCLILLGCTKVSDLSPLAGTQLVTLRNLDGQVRDLSPLEGMPLRALSVGGPIANLAPLRGMPLKELRLRRSKVVDLSPLRGIELTTFDLESDVLTDLSPLQGMPITSMSLGCPKLTNANVLAGMNLEWLSANGPIRDLSFLRGKPLRSLYLSYTGVADLGFLEGMPLQDLAFAGAPLIRDLGPLKGLLLTYLSINTAPVKDLSSLAGMPLDHLSFYDIQASDISPLRGLPLRKLDLAIMPVEDLSPLAGLTQLESLQIRGCQRVKDISPLRGLSLRALNLHDCKNLRQLGALAENKQLERLILPPYPLDLDTLRQLPNLKLLSSVEEDFNLNPIPADKTPAAFWQAYDAKKKR